MKRRDEEEVKKVVVEMRLKEAICLMIGGEEDIDYVP
jgi:hypothetical protein